ncbi:hypothetical protein QQF64_006364 [Cirrhinus molitorella]|uniref:Uncharacterized protein n=1 Tax=Cirrhinus molitorella TaxID=172907 RepID=A0ABR3MF92_9TELE
MTVPTDCPSVAPKATCFTPARFNLSESAPDSTAFVYTELDKERRATRTAAEKHVRACPVCVTPRNLFARGIRRPQTASSSLAAFVS